MTGESRQLGSIQLSASIVSVATRAKIFVSDTAFRPTYQLLRQPTYRAKLVLSITTWKGIKNKLDIDVAGSPSANSTKNTVMCSNQPPDHSANSLHLLTFTNSLHLLIFTNIVCIKY